jgi:hypothetical protein
MTADAETSQSAGDDALPDQTALLEHAFGKPTKPRRRRRSSPEDEETTAGSSVDEPLAGVSLPSGTAGMSATNTEGTDERSSGPRDPDAPSPTSIQVSAQLNRRFRRYQQRQRVRSGREPSNVEVLLEALNACYGRYAELWEKSRRSPESDSMKPFGRVVPNRRGRTTGTSSGRYQISVRTTAGELAQIDDFKNKYAGVDVDRSSFVAVMLDEFLPGGGEASNQ